MTSLSVISRGAGTTAHQLCSHPANDDAIGVKAVNDVNQSKRHVIDGTINDLHCNGVLKTFGLEYMLGVHSISASSDMTLGWVSIRWDRESDGCSRSKYLPTAVAAMHCGPLGSMIWCPSSPAKELRPGTASHPARCLSRYRCSASRTPCSSPLFQHLLHTLPMRCISIIQHLNFRMRSRSIHALRNIRPLRQIRPVNDNALPAVNRSRRSHANPSERLAARDARIIFVILVTTSSAVRALPSPFAPGSAVLRNQRAPRSSYPKVNANHKFLLFIQYGLQFCSPVSDRFATSIDVAVSQ